MDDLQRLRSLGKIWEAAPSFAGRKALESSAWADLVNSPGSELGSAKTQRNAIDPHHNVSYGVGVEVARPPTSLDEEPPHIRQATPGRGLEFGVRRQPRSEDRYTTGEFVLTVLAAIAQFERKTSVATEVLSMAAKRNDSYDRVPKVAPEQIQLGHQRIAQGVPKAQVAECLP